jgi:hypothetical protein
MNKAGAAQMALRIEHGIMALMTMAYAVGSPDAAPMLPRPAEVAFSKLHSDFNDVGMKIYVSGSALANQIGLVPSTPRYQAASAVSGPAVR